MKFRMQPDGKLCGEASAATEHGRWSTDQTLLIVGAGLAQLVTTNGKQLAVCNAETSQDDPAEFSGLLPAKGIAGLAHAEWCAVNAQTFDGLEECDFCGKKFDADAAAEIEVHIEPDGAGGHVLAGKRTGLRLPIGPLWDPSGKLLFPTWQKILPAATKETHALVAVDVELLRRTLQAINTTYALVCVPKAGVHSPLVVCSVRSGQTQASVYSLLMPVAVGETDAPLEVPSLAAVQFPPAPVATNGGA